MTAVKPKTAPRKQKVRKTITTKKKPGKAPKDWDMMKLEYFKAETMDVSPFVKEKFGIETKGNGGIQRRLKGWREEKEEIKAQAMRIAKEKVVQLYVPSVEELAQMHQGAITLFKAQLNKELADCIKDGKVIKMPDGVLIERVWRIVKAEKLEPTAVSKTENSITPEDRSLMRQLLDENFDDDEDEDDEDSE